MAVGAALAARFPAKFPALHRWVYRVTRGRVGHRWTGYPCLLLTTVGRKSGQTRDAVLTYAEVDAALFVAGSNGGNDRPPAWLLNLEVQPKVTVRAGSERWSTTAEVVSAGDDDFDRAWSALNQMRDGRYDDYQRLTSRPIPLVRLRRR
jgi:deazaflavin-dependent oxidoreductase (nitroreductase family)